MQKEEENCNYFLQETSKSKILEVVQTELIEKKAEIVTLKDSGCKFMFNERKVDQLTIMYKVFFRVEKTLSYIIKQMQPYIEQEGGKIVMNEENQKDPNKFTEKLLKFKEDMDNLIQDAFSNDIKFQKSRDQSFQNFMNKFDNTAYNIALYSDH